MAAWVRRTPRARRLAAPPDFNYERWFFDMLTTPDYGPHRKNPGFNLEEFIDRYPDIPLLLETWYGHHTATLRSGVSSPVVIRAPGSSSSARLHGFDCFTQSFAGEVDFGAGRAEDRTACDCAGSTAS